MGIGCNMADNQSENFDEPGASSQDLTDAEDKNVDDALPDSPKSDNETKEKLKELRSTLTEVLGEENLSAQSIGMTDVITTDLEDAESNAVIATANANLSNNASSEKQVSSETRPSGESTDAATDNSASDKSSKYTAPIEDPYDKAWKYLSKHNILALFGTITADIVYGKPDDPLQFMVDEIEKLQEQDRVRKGVIKRTASAALSNDKARPDHEKSILDELPL